MVRRISSKRPAPRSKRRNPPKYANTRVLVSDFVRSWKFYRDALGLRPVHPDPVGPYAEFRAGPVLVALFERALMRRALGRPVQEPGGGPADRVALIFETPDVDGFAVALKRRGVRLTAGPTDRPEWGLRTVHLRDPDGNLIEVYSRLARRE